MSSVYPFLPAGIDRACNRFFGRIRNPPRAVPVIYGVSPSFHFRPTPPILNLIDSIHSSPSDASRISRELHRIRDPAGRSPAVRTAPLPIGSAVSFTNRISLEFYHGRLLSGLPDASRYDRVWGVALSIKSSKDSANTATPRCAHVALRISRRRITADAYRSCFARTIAYLADYTPRRTNNAPLRITRGDIASGAIQRPIAPTSPD